MEEFFLFIVEKSKFLLVAAAVFLLLEFLRPARHRQKPWRKDTALDLIYSFALPVMVYPASVLFSAWLIGQFWPVPPQPSESGHFRQTVTQTFLVDATRPPAPPSGRVHPRLPEYPEELHNNF